MPLWANHTGTRKGQVAGGARRLLELSGRLLDELRRRCAVALDGLVQNTPEQLCFFAVENSAGFAGDKTIRELVKAIEAAAHSLPSMKQATC